MEKLELCSVCKGKCCKTMPGIVFPEQFEEVTFDVLMDYYKRGYCFDYWEGDPRSHMQGKYDDPDYTGPGYYLRPQTKEKKGKIVDPSWGGECILLTETGCKLKHDDRPLECQNVKPVKSFNCGPENKKISKQSAAIAWMPYHAIIKQVINAVHKEI